MHLHKPLLSLLACSAFAFGMNECSAETPTVTLSTNYVATGERLCATGQGFLADELINVFVPGYRDCCQEIWTDDNGCFNADITYSAYHKEYLLPDVQYIFSPSDEMSVNATAHYQEGEISWAYGTLKGTPMSRFSNGPTPMIYWHFTASVARGGNCYDIMTSTNLNGPWTFLGSTKIANTWSNSCAWDFQLPDHNPTYFKIGKPEN